MGLFVISEMSAPPAPPTPISATDRLVLTEWPDACLNALFLEGLDESTIRCDEPDDNVSLKEIINSILYLNGSKFVVDEVPEITRPRVRSSSRPRVRSSSRPRVRSSSRPRVRSSSPMHRRACPEPAPAFNTIEHAPASMTEPISTGRDPGRAPGRAPSQLRVPSSKSRFKTITSFKFQDPSRVPRQFRVPSFKFQDPSRVPSKDPSPDPGKIPSLVQRTLKKIHVCATFIKSPLGRGSVNIPDPPWPSLAPDPPWPSLAPDRPWPPKAPDPPLGPEIWYCPEDLCTRIHSLHLLVNLRGAHPPSSLCHLRRKDAPTGEGEVMSQNHQALHPANHVTLPFRSADHTHLTLITSVINSTIKHTHSHTVIVQSR
ncbi:hypothetical protein DPX16_21205 [Anabarilius grahami]|uniref:Uncharacterized protein n=1 Tax=Anabarilius grahami TaxID=495550 RepID=A0A3N0Z2L5_ANAGA|nr:hypothetical protein DPX16_21205 [Anabarilius grahami]